VKLSDDQGGALRGPPVQSLDTLLQSIQLSDNLIYGVLALWLLKGPPCKPRRSKVRDQATEQIKQFIVERKLVPGDRFADRNATGRGRWG
jgi:hypothetical protein